MGVLVQLREQSWVITLILVGYRVEGRYLKSGNKRQTVAAAARNCISPREDPLLHLWVGIKNAPGILSSNVARIALFALASCVRWPSVVCFAALTQAGMCETSWSSKIKVNFRAFPVLKRSRRVRAWAMVNPYCGACARTGRSQVP
jgi:hypothetical protein